jgi:glucosamine 6-phosphate synthetase-like amidotransferase/phosphosugar isomerase protein
LRINKDKFLVASDPNAILIKTRQMINLDDGEIAILKQNDFFILKEKTNSVDRTNTKASRKKF